jgi:ankyrin repeat protein
MDIRAKDTWDETPLDIAEKRGNAEISSFLRCRMIIRDLNNRFDLLHVSCCKNSFLPLVFKKSFYFSEFGNQQGGQLTDLKNIQRVSVGSDDSGIVSSF